MMRTAVVLVLMLLAMPRLLAAPSPQPSSAPVDLEAGREAYVANCAACHGMHARGGVGPSLIPNHKFKYGSDAASLYKSIAHGHLEQGCPKWDHVMKPDDIRRLVAYLRSLK